eukprot:GHVO01019524.1.p1 GENE.GHVO01019524.1~~GHVO01019524.1.p1  ORF type:complete len:122 (-),score=9.21 GHVO01019524.1:164-529(-)
MDANEEAQNRKRFTLELEFVQSLSNPEYLHALAQKELFSEPAFINYLSYLRYWKKPEYGQFLTFPQCLRMLDALQNPDFREKLSDRMNYRAFIICVCRRFRHSRVTTAAVVSLALSRAEQR